jgi:Icc-related predicted phosphoesterase
MTERPWFFVSDLHGHVDRYRKLVQAIVDEGPEAVLLGGDLLPHALSRAHARGDPAADFVADVVASSFAEARRVLGDRYPRVFVILGNDDPRSEERSVLAGEAAGLWTYLHARRCEWETWHLFGYACVPPSPFHLKDWERYDVSRFVDPGAVAPEDGWHSVPCDLRQLLGTTLAGEIDALAGATEQSRAIWLFHAPPYRTPLDRAALDDRTVDHAPVDVHVGSIAVRRFIERRQPRLTLHGHVHESARLTGAWQTTIGRTVCLSAAHDGPELALVRFHPERLAEAWRSLV